MHSQASFHVAQAHRDDLLRAAAADRFAGDLPEHVRRGRVARVIARTRRLHRQPAVAAASALKAPVSA